MRGVMARCKILCRRATSKLFVLDFANLLHAPFMPAALELGVEPGPHNLRKLFGGRYARAERQDVRIVVFASKGGNFRSPRHGRAHAGHLIGNDGNSRARTTDQETL